MVLDYKEYYFPSPWGRRKEKPVDEDPYAPDLTCPDARTTSLRSRTDPDHYTVTLSADQVRSIRFACEIVHLIANREAEKAETQADILSARQAAGKYKSIADLMHTLLTTRS